MCIPDCHAAGADKAFYATTEQGVAEIQHVSSSETEATVTRAVVTLEWLQTCWEQMAEHGRYRSLEPAIRAGLDNLCKWYKELDASDVYVVCHSTLTLLWVVVVASLSVQ